jgi:hypothetical protein
MKDMQVNEFFCLERNKFENIPNGSWVPFGHNKHSLATGVEK